MIKKDIISGAFTIKKSPYPWTRAISAGICASLPVSIGLLLGYFQYGLLAGIGAFAYLYVFNDPYPHRAKKVFFVMLGLSASMGIGILTASTPLIFSIITGVIGFLGTFIFGALKIPGPASIFFVIVFAMTSGMNLDSKLALTYAGLIFLGGAIAWLVAMIGWIFNPHGPEKKAVQRVYIEIAALLDGVNTDRFNEARERTLIALNIADTTLLAGYTSWKSSNIFNKLYVLQEIAYSIWSDILEISARKGSNIPPELGESARLIAHSLLQMKSNPVEIELPDVEDKLVHQLMVKFNGAHSVLNEPLSDFNQNIKLRKRSLKKILLDSFDKNSIVFISSLKYGVVLMISTMIAFSFEFDRSYWIPISCGAVMLGSTVMSTFHRAIQRSIGTTVGILVTIVILWAGPSPIIIVLLIALLQFCIELFMVRNYVFAVAFITPNVLLIAENTTQIHDLSYFATARITDVIIGCIIGIIGVLLVGRQSASNRLPHLMAKTIRSQSQLYHLLFAEQTSNLVFVESSEQHKLRTNLVNLKTLYATALGELSNKKEEFEYLPLVIFSIEHLGYLLDSIGKEPHRPVLTDEHLAQFLLVFETMSKSIEHHDLVGSKKVPEIAGYSKVQKEVLSLQNALQLIYPLRNLD